MRLWIWRNLKIKLPDDWEMLQFSQKSQVGSCVFADRYQFRLEFNWRVIEGEPDLGRMVSDYMAKLVQEKKIRDAKYIQVGKWRGIEGYSGLLYTSRFGYYFVNESCLIEIVFLWPEKKDSNLEQDILNSVAEEPEVNNCFRRWKSFGMDMLVSKDLSLQTCQIKPAYAKMIFTSSKKEEKFERLGMVPEWLKTTTKEWMLNQTPNKVKIHSQHSTVVSRHNIETLHGYKHLDMSPRSFRKQVNYKSSAWVCPADERLYSITTTFRSPDASSEFKLAGKRLSCCQNLMK